MRNIFTFIYIIIATIIFAFFCKIATPLMIYDRLFKTRHSCISESQLSNNFEETTNGNGSLLYNKVQLRICQKNVITAVLTEQNSDLKNIRTFIAQIMKRKIHLVGGFRVECKLPLSRNIFVEKYLLNEAFFYIADRKINTTLANTRIALAICRNLYETSFALPKGLSEGVLITKFAKDQKRDERVVVMFAIFG